MADHKNTNWIETEDGWVKREQSSARGTSPFDRPMPPVRNANGFPLIRGGGGKIDWNLVEKERAEKRGKA